jgi:antitoxin HigA-1
MHQPARLPGIGMRRAAGSRTATLSTSTFSIRTEDCTMTKDTREYPTGIAHLLPPVHPGSVLADELRARGLTANSLALALRVPANRISDIVRGQRSMTAETALRLGRYLGTGAQLWVNLQAQYDLALAQQEFGAQIAKEVDAA